jgi:hypothetical protein
MDTNIYPGDTQMANAWVGNGGPFYFTGFYLAPAPAHSDTSWMTKRAFLAGIGYGFAIVYVGRQKTSLSYARGQTDGANAISLANSAGFASNVIFLDIEAGAGSISPDLLSYIEGWLDTIDASTNFYPGVYCSYKTNADTIKNSRPNMDITFWVWNLNSPPSPACSTNIGTLSPSSSGVSYASVWQFAQNCQNMIIPNIDLDLADSSDPSAA